MTATRQDILQAAQACITVDRAATHGEAEDSFALIAAYWTIWLGDRLAVPLTALDVSMMMVGFKIARAQGNAAHIDNYVDLVGYAALAAEISGGAA